MKRVDHSSYSFEMTISVTDADKKQFQIHTYAVDVPNVTKEMELKVPIKDTDIVSK
jgi:hypothetical protein